MARARCDNRLVAESEFMKRIDAEMARTNAALEQDRIAWRQAMAEHGSSLQDIRLEMRQMSVRGERLAQGYLRAIEANTQVVLDLADQVRANTQAVLRALHRFDAGGGPAAAGA
jgi:actin-like ATPase involved in cell morphogenesis